MTRRDTGFGRDEQDGDVAQARLEGGDRGLAATDARLAHEKEVGKDIARRDYMTGDEVRRILDK